MLKVGNARFELVDVSRVVFLAPIDLASNIVDVRQHRRDLFFH